MEDPRFVVWAGFRTHLLLPHDVVGGIRDGLPAWPGLTVTGDTFWRGGLPVLQVETHTGPNVTRVTVRALTEVWIQEPGLAVKIAGDGVWQAFGPDGRWTSPPCPLRQKDAHRSTVHFSRVRTNPDFTAGVEYRSGDPNNAGSAAIFRFTSDGGFEKLLNQPERPIPWQHCQVMSRDWRLAGIHTASSDIPRRRWELAGKPPNLGQFYAFGWVGGAGGVVNADGETPAPGREITEADGFNLLSNYAWRQMRAGQSISQTLSCRTVKR